MRREGPAHPLCEQRNELLYDLPDRRPPARRPRSFATAARGLAAHTRRTRSAQEAVRFSIKFRMPGAGVEPARTVRSRGFQIQWQPADVAGLRMSPRQKREGRCVPFVAILFF